MAKKAKNDQTELRLRQAERLRRILLELPEVCYDFILSMESNSSILTRINYAGDLRIFFGYLQAETRLFDCPVPDLTTDDIARIQSRHIEMYLDYLSIYQRDERTLENHNPGKKRKLSAVRTFFKYMLKHGYIKETPTAIIETPKILEKPILRMEGPEVLDLMQAAETGENLTKRQAQYHKNTQVRDLALLSLMLGTGIRISECVNLNLQDMDYAHRSFRVTRKGGKQAILYYSEDVERALKDYIALREQAIPLAGHQDALFLSLQNRRITARAVENLVQKYARTAVPLKKITPHKLRSTFGTALYQATGDIYLVADVLGHSDVNTTRKHYADMSDENRRKAAQAVHYEKTDH